VYCFYGKIVIDASRNVHESADVTLYQLFDKGYIKKNDPLLYYRKTNTHHNTVFSVCKIVNVDNNSQIFTLLPNDPNDIQPLRSNFLTELKKTVVEDFNEKHNLVGDKELKPSKNPFLYFFIGTSFYELRKKYCENN
jgi:hypothetical protein